MGTRTTRPESEDSPAEEKEEKEEKPPPPPQSKDNPAEEKEKTPSPPKLKTFRIVNNSYQTLYLTLPGRTLVLKPGRSQDVPESDIAGNYHVKVMVRRGHIALFEY